jgi:hypothetical protein
MQHRRNHWRAEVAWREAFQVSTSVADALSIATLAFWVHENKAIAAEALERSWVLAKTAADYAALARTAQLLGKQDESRRALDRSRGRVQTPADLLAFAEAASRIDHMGYRRQIDDALRQALSAARTGTDLMAVVRFASYNPADNRELLAMALQRAAGTARTCGDFLALAQFAAIDPIRNRDLIRQAMEQAHQLAQTGTDQALLATVAARDPIANEQVIQEALVRGRAAALTSRDFVELARIGSTYRRPDREAYVHEALQQAELAAGSAAELANVAELTAYDSLAGRHDRQRQLDLAASRATTAEDWWRIADMARFSDRNGLQQARQALERALPALPGA